MKVYSVKSLESKKTQGQVRSGQVRDYPGVLTEKRTCLSGPIIQGQLRRFDAADTGHDKAAQCQKKLRLIACLHLFFPFLTVM